MSSGRPTDRIVQTTPESRRFPANMSFNGKDDYRILAESHPIPEEDGLGVVILDDDGLLVVVDLKDGEGGVGHMALAADRQSAGNGVDALAHRHAVGHHGGNDLGGEGGENVGLYPAAQPVGQHQGEAVLIFHQFHPVAAELLPLFVETDISYFCY